MNSQGDISSDVPLIVNRIQWTRSYVGLRRMHVWRMNISWTPNCAITVGAVFILHGIVPVQNVPGYLSHYSNLHSLLGSPHSPFGSSRSYNFKVTKLILPIYLPNFINCIHSAVLVFPRWWSKRARIDKDIVFFCSSLMSDQWFFIFLNIYHKKRHTALIILVNV